MWLLLIAAWLLQAAQAPPDTEVYLASLTASPGGGLTIGRPVNVSKSPGYDNQPSFTPDGQTLLFTSNPGGTQTDIYAYDLRTEQVSRVTETPESEYSPTITPDGAHISVIRVEGDGTQRLWRFTRDGKAPELVLENVKPVGYHAWADARTLVLFVLGQPATLQVVNAATGSATIVARDIGRSIQRMPGGGISFVERQAAARQGDPPKLLIRQLEANTNAITTLVAAVPGVTEAYCAWTPAGVLLLAHDGALFAWRRGELEWTRIADLQALGLRNATRLAVAPNGDRIAIVADPPR